MISGHTKLFGIIGDPITQIKTPELINPLFKELGREIVAVPFHVTADTLESVWDGLRRIENVVGFGVTVPHKQTVVRLCDRLEPVATRVGAVNCVRRESNGAMVGALFDGIGFVEGLRAQGHGIAGCRVLILGAGGAAAAIAFALAEAGAKRLTIANRTASRAQALAERVNGYLGQSIAIVGAPRPNGHDIIINATALGLQPNDPLPIDPELLGPGTLVAEVIAQPAVTALLAAAKRRGCSVQAGHHMLQQQIALIANYVNSTEDVEEPASMREIDSV
jgi:shikimate dehydrogenase